MELSKKLQIFRKKNGFSQEELAAQVGVSRQAVGKWESGQAYPDIDNLICLSNLYNVAVDRLIKDEDTCNIKVDTEADYCKKELILFLLKAKTQTYAASAPEVSPSRTGSHDLTYKDKEYFYYDTYLGGESFSGEEAVWKNQIPMWTMNYSGRVVGNHFSSDFLKKALSLVQEDKPYRGPGFFQEGLYSYHCKVDGDFWWYQGYEEIYYDGIIIYECYFHGGKII